MEVLDESSIKWKLFIEGDNEAYSWIYNNYVQLLYRYGLQITADPDMVKDCIQDVFVRIYKNKHKISIPKNVKIYLIVSLKNTIYNSLNQERTYNTHSFHLNQIEELPLVENDYINDEERREQQNQIKKIFQILTPRQREIIYHRFIQELEYDEICQIMNLNYQSAYNLHQRSLQKVRDTYGISYLLILSLSSYISDMEEFISDLLKKI